MPDRAGLKTARLFLAIWPGAVTRKPLVTARDCLHAALGGKPSRPETLHLTLVFIGALPWERLPALKAELASIKAAAFDMTFDRTHCWRHNRIACVTPSVPPAELFALVEKLEARLDRLAIDFDRRPYRPHITLVRKADCRKANPAEGRVPCPPGLGGIRPIVWSADSFVLVESVSTPSGVRYDILERYALL